MDKYLGVDLLEALRHHSGTVIGGDRIGEIFIEHRGLMSWAADEIAALKAENDLLKRTILDMKEQYENPPTRTCTTYRAALTQHDSAQDGQEGGNA